MENKMENDVGCNILAWAEAWLANRKLSVCIEGSCLVWHYAMCGMPQESEQGTQAFTIYVSDMEEDAKGNFATFSNDREK